MSIGMAFQSLTSFTKLPFQNRCLIKTLVHEFQKKSKNSNFSLFLSHLKLFIAYYLDNESILIGETEEIT